MDTTRRRSESVTAASDAPTGPSDPKALDTAEESILYMKRDKFAHTRGKRKRTSREDFTILESEYQRNSRPDKATRKSIVERVSLTEKAVQTWFQNRRQMTRRKCRTWQPNEITSIIRSSQEQNETDSPDSSFQDNHSFSVNQTFSSELSYVRNGQTFSTSSQEDVDESSSVEQTSRCPSENPSKRDEPELEENQEPEYEGSRISEVSTCSETALSSSVDNAAKVQEHDSSTQEIALQLSQPQNTPHKRSGLKRKASAARLSTSLDGKAEIVIGNNSPSPFKKHSNPIERSKRAGPLQRSQSAISPITNVNYQLGVDVPEWRKAKPHGRSRDARAWEFYCDSDTRNALAKTAEYDKNGSAQGVLSLIRSNSNNRKPLNPLRRGNLPLQRTECAQTKANSDRVPRSSKLERAMSSMGRLQSPKVAKSDMGTQPSKKAEIWEDNFGDSDKENHDPDGSELRRPSKHIEHVIPSLRDDVSKRGVPNKGDSQGTTKTKETRAHLELDAVQQLLSLSQGAWQ